MSDVLDQRGAEDAEMSTLASPDEVAMIESDPGIVDRGPGCSSHRGDPRGACRYCREEAKRRWEELLPEPETKAEAGRKGGSSDSTSQLSETSGTGQAQTLAAGPPVADRWADGAAFVLDTPSAPPALWGRDEDVLWAQGEPMMIAAPPGLGKTTLAQQLTLASCGIGSQRLLDLPVRPASGRVAYVAADRPAQAARSFARMVGEDDREALGERLLVWRGPLPFDIGRDPARLVPFLKQRDISVVVIDSLGAVAFDLASDEAGSRVFAAFSAATAEGIDVVITHHDRKREQGNKGPRALDDIYGSRWITAAMGSVLYLEGGAGDLVVKLRHMKQPAAEVGPLEVRHDHSAGQSTIAEGTDLLDLAAIGITAQAAAVELFGKAKRNEVEKARRRLDKLADRGDLERAPGAPGEPTIYRRPE
jgi:replicative DNA helicase